jgi:hypothetical protein
MDNPLKKDKKEREKGRRMFNIINRHRPSKDIGDTLCLVDENTVDMIVDCRYSCQKQILA